MDQTMEGGKKRWGLLDRVTNLFAFVGSIFIVFAALSITYEVVMRYVFKAPTIWVAEVTIYFVLAGTFLAVAYGLKEKAHVNVDFITLHLSGRQAVILELFTAGLGVLYCAVLGWEGATMAWDALMNWELAGMILKVPKCIPEAFIPLGSGLLILQLLRLISELVSRLFENRSAPTKRKTNGKQSFVSQIGVTLLFALALVLSLAFLRTHMNLGLTILFFCLLLCGIPVAFALGLFGLFAFYLLFGGAPMMIRLPIMAYSTMDSPVQVALPLYILTSNILRIGQVGNRIYRFANVLVRHLPGGLGIASIIFCGLFASMTGSSVAVAATVSLIALPEMMARGYDQKVCIGLLAAGGTLGILFPPSLPLMLYASMTNESIGDLFMATLIPGVILSVMFCVYMYGYSLRDKSIQREKRATGREIWEATKNASGGLITILIIIGGIYSGLFTPTESGGLASVYSLLLCVFIYKSMSWKKVFQALMDTIRITTMIMLIIIGANITGQAIILSQVPQAILHFVATVGLPSWAVILSINIFLIIMGGPLEAITILVITLPILYPLVTGLGFSGLWFAVIMIVNMELALISPPEGLNLFILQDLSKASAGEVARGVVPFLIIMGLFLALISTVSSLTLWLPTVLKAG
jgi:C4-dicarboxylate transporter, DctM subunit